MMLTTMTLPPSTTKPLQGQKVKVVFQKVEYKLSNGQSIKLYARSMYAWRGGTDGQWECLKELWTRESHWNFRARNPRGGAYGIPQAYPAEKMKKYGADYRHNPVVQVLWGLDYIKYRYNNNACLALKHHNRRGFY